MFHLIGLTSHKEAMWLVANICNYKLSNGEHLSYHKWQYNKKQISQIKNTNTYLDESFSFGFNVSSAITFLAMVSIMSKTAVISSSFSSIALTFSFAMVNLNCLRASLPFVSLLS